MTDYNAKELIHRARTRLLSGHPFYGHLCCRFKLREVTEESENFIPTMATDSVHLFYNPKFVAKLTKTQLVGALAHETEHVYLKHVQRGMDLVKDDEDWPVAQVAMDMAINPHLKDAAFDLIPDAVYPEKEFWNDSFEAHYKRIRKSAKKIKVPSLAGGSCSGVQKLKGANGQPLTSAEKARIESELQMAIMNAAAFAKAAGKLPADIERALGDMRAPKVSWKDVLRRFMQSTSKSDYRMMPPNRRYIHQNLYLPSLKSESVGEILLILDGSGSTYEVFPQFIGEFASIMLDVRPERLHVMAWDTRCTWRKEFDGYSDETHESLAALQSEMGAGGGTVFDECFSYFEEETGVRPQAAIILTDMELYGGWPEDPGYPTIWVATTDIVSPYGETTKIEV